jgi:hypothetical protein
MSREGGATYTGFRACDPPHVRHAAVDVPDRDPLGALAVPPVALGVVLLELPHHLGNWIAPIARAEWARHEKSPVAEGGAQFPLMGHPADVTTPDIKPMRSVLRRSSQVP